MDWSPDKNFIQAKVGYLLLKILLKSKDGRVLLTKPPDGFLVVSKSFMADMYGLLKSEVSPEVFKI